MCLFFFNKFVYIRKEYLLLYLLIERLNNVANLFVFH